MFSSLFKTRFGLASVILLLGSAFAFSGDLPFLVRHGKPEAQIVIAKDPARKTRLAAQELQLIVEKISGAKLPIVTTSERGKPSIYVGISDYTQKLGIETGDLAHGAFRMRSGADWLALVGPDKDFEPKEPYIRSRSAQELLRVNQEWDSITGETFQAPLMSLYGEYHKELDIWEHDDSGTLNAVYEFLRGLGARWYFPGELGEILPKLSDIQIPKEDRAVRPDFDLRHFRYYHARNEMPTDEVLWNLRMGVNPGHDLIGLTQPGHGMKFAFMREEFKEAHPDFFAVRAGQRENKPGHPGSPCLSSKGMLDKHVKFVRSVFDQYDEPMISIDLPDGYGHLCEDDICNPQGTPERGYQGRMSDYVWNYMNQVAKEVHKTHPNKMVSGLAYSGYQLPPEKLEKMSPNLAVIECRWRSYLGSPGAQESFRKLRGQWLEKLPSKQWFVWDYYLHSRPGTSTAGKPAYFPRLIADDLRTLKGVSRGDTIEVYRHPHHLPHKFKWHEFATMHLNLYVTSRLWWDADQNVDDLLDEYYSLYYGPARDQMKAFIEYSEQNWTGMNQSVEKIDEAIRLLKAAQKAVKPESIYGKRIQMVADYVQLMESQREQLARGREGQKVVIPQRLGPPKLDGQADEGFWSGVPEFELQEIVEGGKPEIRTTFRMAWADNDSLYLYVKCEEPEMDKLVDPAAKDGDAALWGGDFVELYLETPTHAYYQIAVSPSGKQLNVDRRGRLNTLWTANAKVATHQGEGYWAYEIQLPAAGGSANELYPNSGISGDKPTQGAPWHFNLGRQRVRDKKPQLTSFTPTGKENFNSRLKMGPLSVSDPN